MTVISFFESGGQLEPEPAATSPVSPSTPAATGGTLGAVTVDPPRKSNSKEGNEYYSGGAQSGLAVGAPPKPKDNNQYVKDLFKVNFNS